MAVSLLPGQVLCDMLGCMGLGLILAAVHTLGLFLLGKSHISGSLYIRSGRGDIAGICCRAKPFGHSARVYGGFHAGRGGGWLYGDRALH